MITLVVNGKKHVVDARPDTPLLWVLWEKLGLTGTKYGCGAGLCGACTVHIDGQPQRSCLVPVKDAKGKKITTIEGIAENHPVKRPGSRTTFRSAVTASRGRSCRRFCEGFPVDTANVYR